MKSKLTFVYFLLTTAIFLCVGSPVLAFSNAISEENNKQDSHFFNSQDDGLILWEELSVFDSDSLLEDKKNSALGKIFLRVTANSFLQTQKAIFARMETPLDERQRLSKFLHPYHFFW